MTQKPLVISAPEPRTLDLIFTDEDRRALETTYDIVEMPASEVNHFDAVRARQVRYVIGQPALSEATLRRMDNLKCVFNVESNLVNNMPYEYLFRQGIYVLTTGAVFAKPVAEMGLAMALCLARDVIDADVAFRNGQEQWGSEGNVQARLLSGSSIGIVGFGDLGQALAQLLSGFQVEISAFDPWLPPSVLEENGVKPKSLEELMRTSDTVFVVASVTAENKGFLNASLFSTMKRGAAFILLSRADVVNFDDLMEYVAGGHIVAASDVYPEEPLAGDHPIRTLKGFIRSAHRAGALDSAFTVMGRMVLEDMALMDQGLPPMRCKRAERETVGRMRSMPVTQN